MAAAALAAEMRCRCVNPQKLTRCSQRGQYCKATSRRLTNAMLLVDHLEVQLQPRTQWLLPARFRLYKNQ